MDQLFVALIATLGALAGSYLGPFMQRKQNAADAKREDFALMRDKAEQAFEEIDKFLVNSRQASVSAMNLLHPDKSKQVEGVTPFSDVGKIRALVATYFPSGLSIVDDFDHDIEEMSEEIAKKLRMDFQKEGPSADAVKVYTVLLASDRSKRDAKFAQDLRAFLVQHVHQFHPTTGHQA